MTAASDTPDILVIGGADRGQAGALAAIAGTPGVAVQAADCLEAAEAILGGARNRSVHLIVIGPDVERPLLLARQLRRISPYSQFLFLRGGDRLKRLSETLAFVPDLSGAWAVDTDAGPQQIRPIVEEAIEASRARRQAATLPDKLNSMLAQVDARKQAEPRRQSLTLWQSFFSAVLSQAPDPIFATDMKGGLLTWNDAAVPFFGVKPEEVGESAASLQLPDPWLDEVSELLGRAASGQSITQHEARLPRADGTHVDLSLSLAPVRDEHDTVVCISFVARDISEQKQLQAQQQLLIRELNHRVKNVLALVQSIARRTARHTGSINAFLDAFDGRLQAMSAAHSLLSESWWRGAALPDIARAVLELHVRDGRIELKLPDLQLAPSLASSLSLVLNELGTNAAKHGALSAAAGCIRLTGREVTTGDGKRQLELEWREEGGPAVGTPDHSGFGTRLITQLIAYQHQGKVELDWAASGLVCRITMPLGSPHVTQRDVGLPRGPDLH